MLCFVQASSACHGPPNSSFFRGLSHLSPQVASQFTMPSITPMQQQGFAPWSGINMHEAGTSEAPVRSRVNTVKSLYTFFQITCIFLIMCE